MGQVQYSEKYIDDTYEYRHAVLPPDVAKLLPMNRLLSEVGSTMLSTAPSHTSCCSGGRSTTSSSRSLSSSRISLPSEGRFYYEPVEEF